MDATAPDSSDDVAIMSAVPETLPPEAPPTPSRPSRWIPLVLFGVVFATYAVTISHTLVSLDVWSADFGSWHLARTGNPWIEGLRVPLLDRNPLRHEWVLQNGAHTVIGRSPGVIAAALPGYALLGTSSFSTAPGGLSAALLTAGAVTLLFLALRTRLTQREALLSAAVFGLATPVWSVAANGMWPHTVTVFGICGMAWAAATGRWWWAGLFGGVTLWGRLHAAVIVAVLGTLVGARRRSLSIVVRVGTVSLGFLALISLWTRWMYGTWNATASYDTSTFTDYAAQNRLSVVNQLGFWVSPDRGILVWTPVILLLVPALARSWRGLPDWSRSLVGGGLAYTVLQGVLNRFSGGDVFYGYRLGLEMLACATPALALSAPRMGRVARSLVGPVLALQVLAIAWGAARDSAWLPADQAWHHNAFEEAVRQAGVAGWCAVALALGIGVLLQRMWNESRRGATSGT
jgi:alpha-1,2-mannosyltransferase